MKTDYTREELVNICEKSSVAQKDWNNRDSAGAQIQVGKCLMLLKAGCKFDILVNDSVCKTNEHTIWIEIEFEGFSYFEIGEREKEVFYLPTVKRLKQSKNGDWY